MLFAATAPERQGEEIRLYFSPDDALAEAGEGRRVYKLAVHYDGQLRRLTAVGHLYQKIDPGWTTSAEYRPDGSIVARGPIPGSLYVTHANSGFLDATLVRDATPSLSSGARIEETNGHRWAGPRIGHVEGG